MPISANQSQQFNLVSPPRMMSLNTYLVAMKVKWKMVAAMLAGVLVVAVIVWQSAMGRFLLTGGFLIEEQPFNPEQWSAVNPADPQSLKTRLLMLDDLMENHLKTGMDSSAVITLLGEPDRKYGFSYNLGALTPGMENVFLIPQFDVAGKVEKLNIESEEKLLKN